MKININAYVLKSMNSVSQISIVAMDWCSRCSLVCFFTTYRKAKWKASLNKDYPDARAHCCKHTPNVHATYIETLHIIFFILLATAKGIQFDHLQDVTRTFGVHLIILLLVNTSIGWSDAKYIDCLQNLLSRQKVNSDVVSARAFIT